MKTLRKQDVKITVQDYAIGVRIQEGHDPALVSIVQPGNVPGEMKVTTTAVSIEPTRALGQISAELLDDKRFTAYPKEDALGMLIQNDNIVTCTKKELKSVLEIIREGYWTIILSRLPV